MRLPIALLSALFTAAVCSPISECRNATYHGVYMDDVESFLGIQYGHDTGGKNRFKPPNPFVPKAGTIVKAINHGPACPQPDSPKSFSLYLDNITEVSEDCLRLNVVRPNGTHAGSKLPVMVYIHGGGFFSGSKDDAAVRPSGLVKESVVNGHPVMHVAINYRLGVFGFAKSAALNRERSENAGLKDQRLALEWVHENIEAFGGDPGKITIHGQSSGGLAIGMQIMAYGAGKPAPFQQAICQSQALEAGITGDYTRKAMSRLANAIGCNNTDLQSDATIRCFRDLSLHELLHAQIATHKDDQTGNIGDEWLPTVDGDFLPAAPSDLIKTGRFYNVTTMIGWCQDDTNYFIEPSDVTNANEVHDWFSEFLPDFSKQNLKGLLDLYPVSDFQTSHFKNGTVEQSASFYRAGRILRDIVMVCQTFFYGEALAKNGNPVFYYSQNQTILTPILESLGTYGYGPIHTSEFAYMFANIHSYNVSGYPFHPRATDYALKDRETRSWSSFAALGRPSIDGKNTLQGWKQADFEDENYGVYVIGGPLEGYSSKGGRKSTRQAIASENLQQRCGFLNRPEAIKQQGY